MSIPFSNPLPIPVLGFCAYSGTGKTTLLKQLIPELNRRGVRLAVIKHAHHNFDVDVPGKDSYEMRKAGARQMLVASHVRWALMTEDALDGDPKLPHLLAQIEADQVDMVLVEGFKKLELPKIELHRTAHGKPFIHTHDPFIMAVACCDDTVIPDELTRLDINNVAQIADYVQDYCKNYQPPALQLPLTAHAPSDAPIEKRMHTVAQGIEAICQQINPLAETELAVTELAITELVALNQLNNRVLAEDAISPVNVPQQTNSAMDGYAFAYVAGQNQYQVVGEVLAGHAFAGELSAGQAVRIMTGAPLPKGADTVQARECTQEIDGVMTLIEPVSQGEHVRLAGEDIALGEVALTKGKRLGAAEIGLLASLGMAQVPVYRQPKVAVFSTGDEVSAPGTELQANCIYDANRFTIQTMLQRLGCEVIDLGIIEDTPEALEQTLSQAATQADAIISSGGVSVGHADFIKQVLAKIGEINFWKINMRPGRPLAFGKIGNCHLFGLPGNPVAAMVSFIQFVQPALRQLAGETHWQPTWLPAITDSKLRSREGRSEFIRGVYHLAQDGRLHVSQTGSQGSGILNSMSRANCLIVLDESTESKAIGEQVFIQPFADLL